MSDAIDERDIRVLADYQCHPLWLTGRQRGSVTSWDPRLGLEPELARRLDDWQAEFDASLCMADPASSDLPSPEESAAFDRRGEELAHEVAAALGPTWSVRYFDRRVGADRQISEATVSYQDELDYLVEYARMAPVYFTIVWDAAEAVAGRGTGRATAERALAELIGDMIDRDVRVGDMSRRQGESVLPWNLTREETLSRIAEEMNKYANEDGFINICWFEAPAGQ